MGRKVSLLRTLGGGVEAAETVRIALYQRTATRRSGGVHTFADTLGGVHLCAVFHGVQGEVDFGQRLLLAHGSHGIVNVLRLVDILLVGVHGGQKSTAHRGSCFAREAVVEEKATRG